MQENELVFKEVDYKEHTMAKFFGTIKLGLKKEFDFVGCASDNIPSIEYCQDNGLNIVLTIVLKKKAK